MSYRDRPTPVFFNPGSAEPKGRSKGRSKMYLRSASAPNTAAGAYSAPADPLARCPLPKNPFPALSALRPRISGVPPKDMGSVSNQNCCKGFRFTEKVEKHWPTDWCMVLQLWCTISRYLWRILRYAASRSSAMSCTCYGSAEGRPTSPSMRHAPSPWNGVSPCPDFGRRAIWLAASGQDVCSSPTVAPIPCTRSDLYIITASNFRCLL